MVPSNGRLSTPLQSRTMRLAEDMAYFDRSRPTSPFYERNPLSSHVSPNTSSFLQMFPDDYNPSDHLLFATQADNSENSREQCYRLSPLPPFEATLPAKVQLQDGQYRRDEGAGRRRLLPSETPIEELFTSVRPPVLAVDPVAPSQRVDTAPHERIVMPRREDDEGRRFYNQQKYQLEQLGRKFNEMAPPAAERPLHPYTSESIRELYVAPMNPAPVASAPLPVYRADRERNIMPQDERKLLGLLLQKYGLEQPREFRRVEAPRPRPRLSDSIRETYLAPKSPALPQPSARVARKRIMNEMPMKENDEDRRVFNQQKYDLEQLVQKFRREPEEAPPAVERPRHSESNRQLFVAPKLPVPHRCDSVPPSQPVDQAFREKAVMSRDERVFFDQRKYELEQLRNSKVKQLEELDALLLLADDTRQKDKEAKIEARKKLKRTKWSAAYRRQFGKMTAAQRKEFYQKKLIRRAEREIGERFTLEDLNAENKSEAVKNYLEIDRKRRNEAAKRWYHNLTEDQKLEKGRKQAQRDKYKRAKQIAENAAAGEVNQASVAENDEATRAEAEQPPPTTTATSDPLFY